LDEKRLAYAIRPFYYMLLRLDDPQTANSRVKRNVVLTTSVFDMRYSRRSLTKVQQTSTYSSTVLTNVSVDSADPVLRTLHLLHLNLIGSVRATSRPESSCFHRIVTRRFLQIGVVRLETLISHRHASDLRPW